MRRRRRVRDTEDEQREERGEEEEEQTRASRRGSVGQSGKRRGGGRRGSRWDYITPFSGSSIFGLSSEDWLRGFDEMRQEMENIFEETIENIERLPKELVREYETAGGRMAREIGPLIYGGAPMLTAEREPLADVTTTDKEVKVTVEMPGISKQDIKVSAYEGAVEVSTLDKAKRKYHRIIDLPSETNIETARSTYSNGILEITFEKQSKPRGREIKVD